MDRRRFMRLTGAFSVIGAVSAESVVSGKQQRPNIVLVMADDQGWGDMGYYGHPVVKTPNFDAMERTSLRLDRFYAAAPVCSPTRASVLTGRHPNRSGVLNHGHIMRPQEITIAHMLKKAGYATGHFGKWHVGSVQKNSPVNPAAFGFDEWLSVPNFVDMNPIMSRNGTAVQCKGESSAVIVEAAVEFIEKQVETEKPFLAVVWFAAPHAPHVAAQADAELYGSRSVKNKGRKTNPALYYAEITAMDRAFGKLRNALKSHGIRENTLLWYTSDNGGLQEASSGGKGKKGAIYEGGLRVPAMIEWPGAIPRKHVTDVPCNTSDIYPTLLELVGLKPPGDRPLDGISLVPMINGKMEARTKPMGFWAHSSKGMATYADKIMNSLLQAQQTDKDAVVSSRVFAGADKISAKHPEASFPGHAAWLDWPWKLHRIQKGPTSQYQLYNLKSDPKEARNLAGQEQERLETMKLQLQEWQASVVRSLNGKDY